MQLQESVGPLREYGPRVWHGHPETCRTASDFYAINTGKAASASLYLRTPFPDGYRGLLRPLVFEIEVGTCMSSGKLEFDSHRGVLRYKNALTVAGGLPLVGRACREMQGSRNAGKQDAGKRRMSEVQALKHTLKMHLYGRKWVKFDP